MRYSLSRTLAAIFLMLVFCLAVIISEQAVKQIAKFFFFQAEDGIRDYKVTGVQTWLFRSRGERGEVDRHPAAVLVVERAAAGLDHLRELLGHRLPDARDAGERLHAAGAVELLERPTVRLDSLRGL